MIKIKKSNELENILKYPDLNNLIINYLLIFKNLLFLCI